MADGLEFNLIGLESVLSVLDNLPGEYRRRGARFAGRKAANLIRNAAIQNVQQYNDPRTPEDIGKNIVVRFSNRRFKRTGDVAFRVGVLGGARSPASPLEIRGAEANNPGGDTFYWRFLEFGTARTRARPFMFTALTKNVDAATSEFINQLDRWTERNLKRLQKMNSQ